MKHKLLMLVSIVSSFGCGSGSGSAPGAEAPAGTDSETLTFESQVEAGMAEYTQYCASCHGDAGQGTGRAPPVVGEEALPLNPPGSRTVRSAQFRTAKDAFDFAVENMPPGDPGSLETEQYLNIFAFALFANGVELDRPLDAEAAESVVLNPE